jgi:outer membrane protein OmpA-like peptidoglycan-associated protein
MIDALRPAATRSMRNLQVRPRADAATADAAASQAGTGDAPSAAASASTAAEPEASAAGSPAGPPPSLSLAIQFELNSSRVRAESGTVLGNLVAAMQSPELRTSRFVIEGHTDGRGQALLNQRLSQERADEVRQYLVALGVHPARLRAVGKGASDPANPLDPLAPENRRVRVVTVE